MVFLLHHDHGRVLGRMSNGTLKLAEDAKGLRYKLTVDPSTPDGQAVIGLVGRRDLKECSFGFGVRAETWVDGNSLPVRTLTEITLYECSIVTWPAYSNTSAALRSLEAHRASEIVRRKIELDLRMRGVQA
ncbi:HK97 family phage prohead protease [Phyllobacterium sp. 1468]|nr:HK97 family phage prohead protease [Phyllobacterium sp. 1468]